MLPLAAMIANAGCVFLMGDPTVWPDPMTAQFSLFDLTGASATVVMERYAAGASSWRPPRRMP
jgi:hypothetical protein